MKTESEPDDHSSRFGRARYSFLTMIPLRAFQIAFKVSPRAGLAALWAAVRGLRVRARNIVYAAAYQDAAYYDVWTTLIEPEKVEAYCQASPAVEAVPGILALIFGGANGSIKDAARTAASIRAALGRSVTIYCDIAGSGLALDCVELPAAERSDLLSTLALTDPEAWVFPTIAGDQLASAAGAAFARALGRCPDASIIYWDEDRLDGSRRRDPWLKPDWDEILFLARDMLTGAGLFKISALFGSSGSYPRLPLSPAMISEAVISLVARTWTDSAPFHIPLILSHRCPKSIFASAAERKSTIEAAWTEAIELAEIVEIPGALRPRFVTASKLPKVSILIPTRNRHDLLRICMTGLSRVEYDGEIEIMVIDNESNDAATLDYLAQLEGEGVIVIRYPGPFNFSAMNNQAARMATGALLCLLNNDIEMHDGFWLEAMVRHAIRPRTGAVGALLQYPDGTVQHAGVSIGTGEAAGHVHRGIPIADHGHRDMHRLTRHVSAVTAACLVVRKTCFLEVGGLDETAFRVAFNDVDLCLKLSENGYRNILVGEARLTHHESKSRGSDFSDGNRSRYLTELAHLQERWGTKGFVDPYHHPLAMRSSEKFVLGP